MINLTEKARTNMELLDLLKKDINDKYTKMIDGETKHVNEGLKVSSPELFISNYNTILNRLAVETQSINKRLDYIAKIERKNSREKRKDEKYIEAIKMYETGNYSDAKQLFDELNGYKDSFSYMSMCQQAINNQIQEQNRAKEEAKQEEIRRKKEQIEEQHLALQKARIDAEEKEKRRVRNKSLAILFVSILAIVGLIVVLFNQNKKTSNNNISSNSNNANIDVQNNEQHIDDTEEPNVLEDLVKMAGQEAILPDQCEYFSYSTNETISHRSNNYKCFFMDIYVPDDEINTFTNDFRQKLLNNGYQELNSNCYQKNSTVIFFTEPEFYEDAYSIGYYAFIE